MNNIHCLNNITINNSRWSHSGTSIENERSIKDNKSYSKNQLSSISSYRQIPKILSIDYPQAESRILSTLGGQKIYAQPMSRSLSLDGDLSSTIRPESRRQYLPNGPPPFKPPMLALSVASRSALEKLKQTLIFKRMYRPKIYYLFLDTLRQLTVLAENLSRKKLAIASSKYEIIRTIINKLALKGNHALKLKWPLILLNPKFLKEILSNPTFLVTLFHAVEVAYMSVPMNFWLKPLMKSIAQPSPEKEEKIWWRRKRLYDTLNGHDASELQPNLKTVHFRNPGKPTPIAIPALVRTYRAMMNRPEPDPSYHKHVTMTSTKQAGDDAILTPYADYSTSYYHNNKDSQMTSVQEEAFLANQIAMNQNNKEPENAATTLIENETSNWPLEMMESNIASQTLDTRPSLDHHQQLNIALTSQDDWLSQQPSEDQLMSQHEFDSLDPREKDMVLSEARQRLEESKWANELIKEHSDFIDSFTKPNQILDDSGSKIQSSDKQTNTESPEPPTDEDTERSNRRHSFKEETYSNLRRYQPSN